MFKVKYKFVSHGKGFTLVELVVTLGILILLLSLIVINLLGSQQKASQTAAIDILEADLKEQQIKAMIGDTEGRASQTAYGIRFFSDRYVLFYGTSYSSSDPANHTVMLEGAQEFVTTLPGNEIIFAKGSGEVSSYASGSDTVTLRNTSQNEQKTITLNKLGVITQLD